MATFLAYIRQLCTDKPPKLDQEYLKKLYAQGGALPQLAENESTSQKTNDAATCETTFRQEDEHNQTPEIISGKFFPRGYDSKFMIDSPERQL
jgi:hypothetical protein